METRAFRSEAKLPHMQTGKELDEVIKAGLDTGQSALTGVVVCGEYQLK